MSDHTDEAWRALTLDLVGRVAAARRFLLFSGPTYDPLGGAESLAGCYPEFDAALEAGGAITDANAGWAHIFDIETGLIVAHCPGLTEPGWPAAWQRCEWDPITHEGDLDGYCVEHVYATSTNRCIHCGTANDKTLRECIDEELGRE